MRKAKKSPAHGGVRATRVDAGEHSICSRKRKGGYGIRPYDIMEIYLFLRREQAPALRYEIVFSAKNADAMHLLFFLRKSSKKVRKCR